MALFPCRRITQIQRERTHFQLNMGNTVESATVEKDSSDDEERVMSRQDNGDLWTVSKFYDEEEDEFLTEFEHVYKDPMSTICVERSIEVSAVVEIAFDLC